MRSSSHVYYRHEYSGKLRLHKPNRTGLTAERKIMYEIKLQFTEQAGLPPAGRAPSNQMLFPVGKC